MLRPLRLTLLLAVLASGLACAPEDVERAPAASEPVLRGVPEPDLAAAAADVRAQLADARAHLDELLADPSSAPAERAQAFGDLGLRYLLYDFLDAAAAAFDNARALAPGDFRWTYLAGYLQLTQGRLDPAVELLEDALELQPDFLPAVLRLARARLERGETVAARQLFQRALELDPSSAAAFEGLGKAADAEGDARAAADYFEQALAQAPEADSLHYALGQAYRNLGNLERARYHLERRGEVPVRVPDPLLNPLADVGAGPQFYLIRGAEAAEAGDYETAAAAYARAVEEAPEDFQGYRGLSYAVEKLGDLRGAIGHLETALQRATTGEPERDRRERAETLRVLGGLEALAGDDAAAAGHFARSLELEAEQPAVRMKLANALARTGRFEEALGHYDLLLASHPELAGDLYSRRATTLVNLGRRDAAIADFRRAVAAAPEDAQLRLRFAEALEYLGEKAAAAEQFAAASRLTGDDAERARLLAEDGRRLVTQGRYDEAIVQLTESLRLAPDAAPVRSEYASVLGHLGRFDEAIAEFRKVIEAAPRHATARRGEIVALMLTGRYGEARVRLQEALYEFPQDAQLAHVQARMLATVPDPRVRDGRLALEIARRLAAARQDLRVRETLAMALAEAGQLAEAVEVQRGVVAEAERRGDAGLVKDVRGKLAAFTRGEAWTAASADEILAATLGTS